VSSVISDSHGYAEEGLLRLNYQELV